MTSQLALMNKTAVALASDSAVTIGEKTYDGAKKVFTLKGGQPIGFMISGAGTYLPCNVDWERVIGLFGDEIGDENLLTVTDYVTRFKKFLSETPKLQPNQENSTFIQSDLIEFLEYFLKPETKRRLDDVAYDIENLYDEFPGLDEYISKSMNDRLNHFYNNTNEMFNELEPEEKYIHNRITKFHENTLKTANEYFCKMYNLSSKQSKKTLSMISYHLAQYTSLSGSYHWRAYTGLVIAGFGSDQLTPELVEFHIGAIVDPEVGACSDGVSNIIRIRKDLSDEGGLEYPEEGQVSSAAFIIPYAEKKEIQNILNGVHDDFFEKYLQKYLPMYIRNLVLNQLSETLNEINGIGPSTQSKIDAGFRESSESLRANIQKEIKDGVYHFMGLRRGDFRLSTRNMSARQLAELAKKLVSMEAEITYYTKTKRTVGGDIIVATITKENGFVIRS